MGQQQTRSEVSAAKSMALPWIMPPPMSIFFRSAGFR
jgi:hypothetical protein